MKSLVRIWIVCLGFLLGCRDPFEPPAIRDFDELIVIDANVNGTSGEALVTLSISKALSSEDATAYISGADVYLQSEGGAIYDLSFQGYGTYRADNVFLEYGDRIKLHVVTGENGRYESEYEEFIETPEIDSVTFNTDSEGVQFYVSTHNTDNSSQYYKWEYFETWVFSSAFDSYYIYDTYPNGDLILSSVRKRDPLQLDSMRFCFRDNISTKILLGSSENLTENIISENELFYSSYAKGKFKYRYSVLIKQNALTKRAYDYWSILGSNTEDIGSIFDKQPSNFESNIVNVSNPEDAVLGYFSVFSETEKRIFIDPSEVPDHETSETLSDLCGVPEILLKWDPQVGYSPLSADINGRYIVIEYTDEASVSSAKCCDCRLTGYKEVPEFWEE